MVNGGIFANPVPVTEHYFCGLTVIFQILIRFADYGKLPGRVIEANMSEAVNTYMRGDCRIVTDLDTSGNDAKRTDRDVRDPIITHGSIKQLIANQAEGEIDIALSYRWSAVFPALRANHGWMTKPKSGLI